MLEILWKQKHDISKDEKDEAAVSLLPEAEHERREQYRRTYSLSRIILLIFSYGIVAALGTFFGSNWRDTAAICAKLTARYSPLIEDVGLSYHTVLYNGSFFKLNAFRQDAGPDVDTAWESLGVDYRAIVVPADQAAKFGLAHDQVRISEKYGGGYPANVEGLHHLHCLNLLRKSLHWNFEYYHALGDGAFKNSDVIVKNHVTHCLDIIRQQLMCSVDVGILGQVWWDPDAPKPFVDFNTKHTCRDFEEIRQWAEERQLPEHVPKDFLAPPQEGDLVLPSVP